MPKAPNKKSAAKPAGGVTPKADGLDRKELAAQYGWALSVLKSSPDLWATFNKAVKQTWTPDRFVAELRNTKWFQTHSEAARNAQVLRTSDPGTWGAKVKETRALVRDAAVQLGSQLTDATLAKITSNVLTYGWNDAQIRDTLAASVKSGAQGTYGGQAAADVAQLRGLAASNGVKIGEQTLNGWVQRIAAGESIDGFEAYVGQMASSAFPQFADHIATGKTVKDVADPYINQMADTLELNPADIDLFDPTIRKALQGVDTDGKPTVQPLWSFERGLKADARWRKTNNARDELMGAGQQVLRDFGLSS